MPLVEFIWFERPLEKISEHGVTRAEVEQVVRAARLAHVQKSRKSDHRVVQGYTSACRKLMVVFDWADDAKTTVVPVTAYERD